MATTTTSSWSAQRLSGFKIRTNFIYYALLATPSIAFILIRYKSMFINSVYCNPNHQGTSAPPGECYWYLRPGSRYYWGIQLHLSTCFPALALAILQFTPSIRQKYPAYHRWAGRTAMVLGLIASFATFLFADVAMGGTWSLFTLVWTLGPMSIWGHYKAWKAIRSGEIHIHRRWMLRTWAWLGSIITMRPLVLVGVALSTAVRSWYPIYMEFSCEKLLTMTLVDEDRTGKQAKLINVFQEFAEECTRPEYLSTNLTQLQAIVQTTLTNGTRAIPQAALQAVRPDGIVMVPADFASKRVDQATSAFYISFGWAAWIALVVHFIVVELYLDRTKEEDDRLSKVSNLRRRKPKEDETKKASSNDIQEKEKKTL